MGRTTCIIGARGRGGAVLVSDRLILKGNEVYEEDKIHLFGEPPLVAVGFAGFTGIRDKLGPAISVGMDEYRVRNLDEVVSGIEDVMHHVRERYADRFEGEVLLEAVVGGLSQLHEGSAEIHTLLEWGYAERIREFDCVGSAGPHAASLLKLLYRPNLDLDELVRLCAFVVLLIEGSGIDRNVGGYPDAVKFLDDEGVVTVDRRSMRRILRGITKESAFAAARVAFQRSVAAQLRRGGGG